MLWGGSSDTSGLYSDYLVLKKYMRVFVCELLCILGFRVSWVRITLRQNRAVGSIH